jgi:hypothetical protein
MLTLPQVRQSYLASNAILSARRKSLRSYILKSVLIVMSLFFYASLLLSINMGLLLYTLVVNPQSDTGSLATILEIMKSMGDGDYSLLGTIGIIAFASYVFFSPLIGTATLSLVSEDESISLGLPRGYRFFNSLILNIFSAVSILQLMVGYGIASVFSIEGSRLPTVILFTMLWFFGALMSTLIGWARESMIIRIGFIKTLLVWGVGLGLLGLILVYSGIQEIAGQKYGEWLVDISKFNMFVITGSAVFITLASMLAIYLGVNLSHRVVSRTFPSENKASSKRAILLGKVQGRLLPLMVIIHNAVWRTKEVRRTMIIVFLLSLFASFFILPTEISIIGILIAIPAIISLSWLANILGLLGGGVLVFGSDIAKYRVIPGAALLYGIFLSILLSAPVLLGLLNGARIDSDAFSAYISVSILNSVLLPSIAILFAVGKPFRARLEGRGDTLVPPLVSLGYISIIGSAAMISGNVIVAAQSGVAASLLFILTAVIIGLGTYLIANYYWASEAKQYRIMKTINGD